MPQLAGPLPTRVHSTHKISTIVAQNYIQAYTDQSLTKPHLHPDSYLTNGGVSFSTYESTGGIIINFLRRTARGLGGEVLGPDDFKPKDKIAEEDDVQQFQLDSQLGAAVHKNDGVNTEEGMDPDLYALQQEGAQTPTRERSNYIGTPRREAQVSNPEESLDTTISVKKSPSTVDKQEGKRKAEQEIMREAKIGKRQRVEKA